ncbi:hypothetical protein [Moorena sp. SIO4A1]|nr:hypothetical protein [Moorena sp. SIO4A1]
MLWPSFTLPKVPTPDSRLPTPDSRFPIPDSLSVSLARPYQILS